MIRNKERKDAKPRGRYPTVHLATTKGGMITVRLPKELHQQFADHCRKIKKRSLNSVVVELIQAELGKAHETSTQQT